MKYTIIIILALSSVLYACKSEAKKQEEKKQDSIDQSQMNQVEQMRKNEDSLIKAEEERLMEQYK